jgi:hypothetical protein
MLGQASGKIGGATVPVKKELAFGNAVCDPVEVHVSGFWSNIVSQCH